MQVVTSLLAALAEDPALSRPRRLPVGAVLPGGHVDLLALEEAADEVLARMPAAAVRGLWLAVAVRASVLVRFEGLMHLATRWNGEEEIGALAGLRSLALSGVRTEDVGGLCDMLLRSGVLHVALAGEVGMSGARALAGALRADPRWRTLRIGGLDAAGAAEVAAAAMGCTHLARLELGVPLAPGCLARLAHNANRGRIAPPPDLARLRAALPPVVEQAPPLPEGLAADDLAACLRVLKDMSDRPDVFRGADPRVAAVRAAVLRLARAERRATGRRADVERALVRARRREEDRRRDAATGIRRARRGAFRGPGPDSEVERGELSGPDGEVERGGLSGADSAVERGAGSGGAVERGELSAPRACYVCKRGYRRLHFFYDRLCPQCAAYSYARREEQVDLRGRTALVTGGRVKIGHAVALRLLRWGARVIVTTRFPRDAARRFAEAADFASFADRLIIYPLDLRDVPAIEQFAAHLESTLPRLDILINNAAQTVWRPPAFYAELLAQEGAALPAGAQAVVRALPGAREQAAAQPSHALFPAGSDDGFGQPVDLRERNSWRLRLHEVDALELVEVQLINAVAPFLLTARLRRLMAGEMAFVVHVSAPEGRFYRAYKSPFHPHTNMAKAGLNMLTRTSAEDFAGDRIYMNSVDTGWISNENPRPIAEAMDADGFAPPLDRVDAAARVCDPIVRGYRDGEPVWGFFLKDFRPISW